MPKRSHIARNDSKSPAIAPVCDIGASREGEGSDAGPAQEVVDEIVTEMRVKAGQKCTAIRRVFVPAPRVDVVLDALRERLRAIVVGDPADPTVTMGALASLEQREEVRARLAELRDGGGCETILGDADAPPPRWMLSALRRGSSGARPLQETPP